MAILETIKCPKFPDHGLTVKRWLRPDEREALTLGAGDVYEIDCHHCGKYECRDEPPTHQPACSEAG
jgi:hypothetical protein